MKFPQKSKECFSVQILVQNFQSDSVYRDRMRGNYLKIDKYLVDLKKISGESKSWIAYMLVLTGYMHTDTPHHSW